jgi:DNA-binding MarR family transcriptional regulator/type II secretory pathway predicted ATPase ExeA
VPEVFDNPYRPAPGSLPPELAGRTPQISAAHYASGLTRTGGAAQPIVFTGLRGMGKTALLRYSVAAAEELGAVVLYSEASTETSLAAALRRSLEHAKAQYAPIPAKIRKAFDVALRSLPKATYELPGDAGGITFEAPRGEHHEGFVEALETLNAEVRRHDRFLLLAVDEIQDGAINDLRVLVRFVHLTAGTAAPVLLLGAGLPNTPAHLHAVRTYTERWRYSRIGLLAPDDTIQAIANPATARGVTFEPAALQRLVDETAGYPFFIQEYASAAWSEHRAKRVTLADVEAIAPGVRNLLESSFYDERFRRLTPRELRYTLCMADIGAGSHTVGDIAARLGVTSENVSSVRNQLVKKDVIFAPAAGLVEFRMPLTEQYIARHRTELERRAK